MNKDFWIKIFNSEKGQELAQWLCKKYGLQYHSGREKFYITRSRKMFFIFKKIACLRISDELVHDRVLQWLCTEQKQPIEIVICPMSLDWYHEVNHATNNTGPFCPDRDKAVTFAVMDQLKQVCIK